MEGLRKTTENISHGHIIIWGGAGGVDFYSFHLPFRRNCKNLFVLDLRLLLNPWEYYTSQGNGNIGVGCCITNAG
jgi:hypothetical protein